MMKDEENVPGTTMQLHQPPPTPTAPSRASPAYPPPGHLYYPYAYQSVPGPSHPSPSLVPSCFIPAACNPDQFFGFG